MDAPEDIVASAIAEHERKIGRPLTPEERERAERAAREAVKAEGATRAAKRPNRGLIFAVMADRLGRPVSPEDAVALAESETGTDIVKAMTEPDGVRYAQAAAHILIGDKVHPPLTAEERADLNAYKVQTWMELSGAWGEMFRAVLRALAHELAAEHDQALRAALATVEHDRKALPRGISAEQAAELLTREVRGRLWGVLLDIVTHPATWSDMRVACGFDRGTLDAPESVEVLATVRRAAMSERRAGTDMRMPLGWARDSDKAGMLWLDAELCHALDDTGATGQAEAERVRGKSGPLWASASGWQATFPPQETIPEAEVPGLGPPEPSAPLTPAAAKRDPLVADLFRLWWPDAHGLTQAVARLTWAAWCDKVRPELGKSKHPALPLGFAPAIMRSTFARDRRMEIRDGMPSIVDQAGKIVGRIHSAGLAGIPPDLLFARSASMTMHRYVRWLPSAAREQAIRDRLTLSRAMPVLTIDGGLRELAERMGENPKETDKVRFALNWAQHVRAVGEDGTEVSGLATWELQPHAPGRAARLIITPAAAILLGGGRGKLVPVPRHLPRFIGARQEWTPQASLQLLALEELRRLAAEMVQASGALIPARRWEELADLAGVSKRRLRELLGGAWLEAGASADGRKEAPAFLRREGDRWTLAPAYGAELAELTEGGVYDFGQAERGRKSAARRRQAAAKEAARALRDGGK